MSRKTVISMLEALALGAAISAPALAAAPTFSGTATCISTVNGDVVDAQIFTSATKGDISFWRRHWTRGTGFCESGTFDTSGLTQDP